MTGRRGDVVWVDFGEPRGSAPAYVRPALVVQSDRYNDSRIATTVVVAITSNTALARFEDNVFLPAGTAGLDRDSVVNVTQVFTVDRSAIESPVGSLPASLLDQVADGVRSVLGI
ncbi:type II toxin-antitoxin system PemK/MazF family toxin [Xylanimonas protaetiae]|uniref:mRNA interferase n=1 Tax=Xylanimonas protaetiae TaxID=2509457 RepID=A0A4P6F7L1_9MICO|nr:type II toxin-antitoxin system PemK/MazF family toxin [Xylanimonas protaetiae]QAY70279.1 type II toxin-antitoxin system PemK/MazF family toxin [Xylanimonas protaetiae]